MNIKITTRTEKSLDGNHAVAEAIRQINPDVFGFYPITPTSYIGEAFSKAVANGDVETEYVCAESEHAAMSICVGAAAAGGRAVSATASQGLILMAEVLWNASGMRLPIVAINGNRALSAPLSIHCSHDDAYAIRDAGWIQLFAENPQEAYDLTLCAFSIAEAKNVRTPLMVGMDCFLTTHTTVKVQLESDKNVQKFIGDIVPGNSLFDLENPKSFGTFAKPDTYQEFKYAQLQGQHNALERAETVFSDFEKKFGRLGGGLVTKEGGGKIAVVCLGAIAGTVREIVKRRDDIALVRPRMFRPFPVEVLKEHLKNFDQILVLDRNSQCGAQFAPLAMEIKALGLKGKIKNVVFGLGSRETNADDIEKFINNFEKLPDDIPSWCNLREK
jgi:pyruvate ferredoxin oxidoreductase alpha subunit